MDASSIMSTGTSNPTTTTTIRASFFAKLEARVLEVDSHLCVGLDPHQGELFPDGDAATKSEDEKCDAAYTFCKTIIDETAEHTAAYKPNAAFFEALGPNKGNATLRRVIASIPSSIPTLLDVKRGDIGSTAQAYADACYEESANNADGVTLSPLMGYDSVKPFITGGYKDRGAFLLCKTSNPGSDDLLSKTVSNGTTLYETIAKLVRTWSDKAQADDASEVVNGTLPLRLGLVVGATDPQALEKVRVAVGEDVWILAPGVGAQGGDLDAACRCGMNASGSKMLIPVSRGISRAKGNLSEKAKEFKDNINNAKIGALETVPTDETGASRDVTTYQKDFLEFSLALGVLKFGSFVLKSGRTSPYFFNAGLFSTGAALHKVGKAYAAAIMASPKLTGVTSSVNFDVIFGPAYKGISLGAVICAALYNDYGIDVGFAYDRKEAKDHGEGGKLVGASMADKRVLVVDDVITAGTAIRESYDMLSSIQAIPVGVVIALDRAEKRALDDPVSAVQAVSRDLNIPVISIVSLPQLQGFLLNNPAYGEESKASVSEYRRKYGV